MERPSIKDLLKAGHAKLKEDHAAKEKDKLGTLRGGNSGALINGEFYGKCPRVSFLRMVGVDKASSAERELMFAAGRTNEDSWNEVLQAAWPGQILREEEVPVTWATGNGTKVTGRPDFVLTDAAKRLLVGIELKLVSSLWTVIGVFVEKKPKTDHVIQAAHYSMALTVPFELWYTSRVDWPIIGWVAGKFSKLTRLWKNWWGESHYEFRDDGTPKKVLPFYQGYELQWSNALMIKPVDGTAWEQTRLTQDSIRDYYEYVSRMGETKVLGPRPADKGIGLDGKAEPYSQCDYCPFRQVCDQHEHNFDEWLNAARKM